MARGEQFLATAKAKGVYPFFRALPDNDSGLHAARVAHRIVGLPLPLLCVYAQIASVYASVASKGALAMLRGQGANAATERVVSFTS